MMILIKIPTIFAIFGAISARPDSQVDYQKEFVAFVKEYNRVYKDAAERQMRFETFSENLKNLNDYAKISTGNAKFGVNKFSDWTSDEKARLTPYNQAFREQQSRDYCQGVPVIKNADIPQSFDWREQNIVTPVKDQGNCGSCWAFATIAVVEAQIAKATGQMVSLSEQELVDCAINLGCNGGAPSSALLYIQNFGISEESAYPYMAKNDKCVANNSALVRYHIDTYVCVDIEEDNAAYWLTQLGPMTHDIWVTDSLYGYKSGVWAPSADECMQSIVKDFAAHVVTIVGYGVEDGIPYWLVKNSWGADWGDHGFFKLHRGDKACSLLDLPFTVPIVKNKRMNLNN